MGSYSAYDDKEKKRRLTPTLWKFETPKTVGSSMNSSEMPSANTEEREREREVVFFV